jgi:hypothetical protein
MGRDAGFRDASALDYVRSRSVGGLSSSRRAWCPQSRCTTSPPRPAPRLRACRERGASHETDREVFQRSDGIRRCLPGSHDRNACRSFHSHDRPRFSSLPSAQPPGSPLCDSRMICKLVWQGAGRRSSGQLRTVLPQSGECGESFRLQTSRGLVSWLRSSNSVPGRGWVVFLLHRNFSAHSLRLVNFNEPAIVNRQGDRAITDRTQGTHQFFKKLRFFSSTGFKRPFEGSRSS